MQSKTWAQGGPTFDPFHWSADVDVLASQQYREQWHGTGNFQSEKKLMFAVLLDAIECFQKYATLPGPYARRLFDSAEDWIFENNRDWPFSFVNVCEAMEIDPSYLRKGLLEWKRRLAPQPTHHPPHRRLNMTRPLRKSPMLLRSLY